MSQTARSHATTDSTKRFGSQRWNITPFVGVGPLKLGMSMSDVAKFNDAIGEPTPEPGFGDIFSAVIAQQPSAAETFEKLGINVNAFNGVAPETRAYLKIDYYGGKLGTIDLFARGEFRVFLDNIDLFNTDSLLLLQQPEKKNGGAAKAGLGMVYFDKLGLTLGDYYSIEHNTFHDVNSTGQDDRDVCIDSQEAIAWGDKNKVHEGFTDISFLTITK